MAAEGEESRMSDIYECFKAKNVIFLGEAGSGKTELSVNSAKMLAAGGDRVKFFDMDQTKGLFRARDLSGQLADSGVELIDTFGFHDSPIIPYGVTGHLSEPGFKCVFDVGGNATGAIMMGQFSDELRAQDSMYYYVINPLRPFSGTIEKIVETIARITSAAGIDRDKLAFVSNPCIGYKTTPAIVLEQHEWLAGVLAAMDKRIAFLACEKKWADDIGAQVTCPVLPITVYVKSLYER
jgi:hypothetical protein